ncbi:cation diffusion facilitator family transporter [Candidatus Ruminimicrobiellum ovillum]|uniref:cation diffusion facilitator family transporter n=1 Tax=Candidatus Ruminimicrobiellum ovillum TaxID=1947927 RepID=UPI00355A82BC
MENKEKEIKNVTVVGVIVNLFLSITKLIIGYLGNSQALIADGVHSFSDLATDLSIIFGVKYWLAPADEEHQYGHRKIELLVTIFIAIALAFVGISIFAKAILALKQNNIQSPSLVAFIGAMLSIISKEWLYRYTAKKANMLKSPAVKANAWHHRSDAISSLPVAIVIVIAAIFPKLIWLDAIGAIVVSVFIIYPAYTIFKKSILSILDESVDSETLSKIEQIALQTKDVKEVHDIRTRKAGETFFVDMHILVDGNISVQEGHDISEEVKLNLMKSNKDILDVLVHLEPFNEIESKQNK